MATIPSSTKFIGLAASVNTTERRSALINSESEAYTMQDVTDTVRPYKVFTAIISQSGTSNPTAIVYQNTFGINFNFVRTAAGNYQIQDFVNNPFITNKSFSLATINGGSTNKIVNSTFPFSSVFAITTLNPSTGAQEDLNGWCQVEIRVYN